MTQKHLTSYVNAPLCNLHIASETQPFTWSKWDMNLNHNFWPKIANENWSRKDYFEIPSCEKLISLTLRCQINEYTRLFQMKE